MTNHKKNKVIIWGLILLFAILITIPFIIPHCGFISLFAFIPLFFLENYISTNNVKHKFIYYYSSFILFNVFTTFWVWNASAVGAIAAIILNALQMSIVFQLFCYFKKRLNRKWIAYIAFVVMWLAWEHTYFNVQISWPWLVLGNAFATSPYMVQWYEITGSLGGSLWILATNILLYFAITSKKRCTSIAAIATILIPVVFSTLRYSTYSESDDTIKVLAIQPNINPYDKFGVLPQYEIDDRFIELVETNISPETKFIISPETFTYNINLDSPESNTSFLKYQMLLHNHPETKMILGALTNKVYHTTEKPSVTSIAAKGYWYDVYNTIMLIDSNGVKDYYHKSKLVPAVECTPYIDIFPFLGDVFEFFGGSRSGYATMDDMKPLIDESSNISGLICYESIYGEYARRAVKDGAEFVTIITNDGWWGDTPGYKQHFRYALLRAIETRRDVVFVANTGITGFIDQRGSVKSHTEYWTEATLEDTVNINKVLTPFTKYGDIIGVIACWLMITVALLFIFTLFAKNSRK